MGGIGAALSGFMNNVAALALLMPVDIQTAKKARRNPGLTLMPLSFATILGGMVTLIGTPPNIIIASYRDKALGQPFLMFDFAPVGAVCALAGLAFVATVGWRPIPRAADPAAPPTMAADTRGPHPTHSRPAIRLERKPTDRKPAPAPEWHRHEGIEK